MRLEGKTAIVTGASSGMGKAISALFVKEGANVIAVARRKERLEALEKELADEKGTLVPYPGDISKKETNEAMIDFAIEKFGKLDILVNNAGILDDFTAVGNMTEELWNDVFRVNLDGPMWAMSKAVNVMKDGGSIVNISSVGGLNGCRAGAAYTASKHALNGLTKSVAYMYAPQRIRCNAIAPGGVDTEVSNNMKPDMFGMDRARGSFGLQPFQGTSEQIAQCALFLAGDESELVNGAILIADAGWTAI